MSMPRADRYGRIQVAIRIDPELWDRLSAEADARVLSRNFLIERLLAESIDRLLPVGEFFMTRRPPTAEA